MEDDLAPELHPQHRPQRRLSSSSASSENTPNADSPRRRHPGDNRPRKQRHRIKGDALQTLETYFLMNPRPSSQDIVLLSRQTGETEHRVRIWFNNRRGKHSRQVVAEEASDTDLLSATLQLSTGQSIDLSMIDTEDELTARLRDRILLLQQRLQEIKRQQQCPVPAAARLQLLPPISSLFEHSMEHDLGQLKQSLHQLLTRVASIHFTQHHCPREVHVTLEAGGEAAVRALECCGPELARPVYNHQRRHYIILGPNVLRLLRDAWAGDEECLVLCPSGYSVLVEGVCVVPFAHSGDGVLLRAACTLLPLAAAPQHQRQHVSAHMHHLH